MKVFIVAGEHSGDQLGFKLMRALKQQLGDAATFAGVGGEAMVAEGLQSLFPLSDIAVMGIVPVIRRLPWLLARIAQTARAAVEARPDVLVLIDSPDFTHRVAARVRRKLPDLPVVDYVSPTVWAWRPGRARKMRPHIDHVLALLPFEPDAHRRLDGPECTYVGHPLIERLRELRPDAAEAARREMAPPRILVMPGSRRSEIDRFMPDFGAALALVAARAGPVEAVIPALPRLEQAIRRHTESWAIQPLIATGETAKLAAFRTARAALCKSGTGTLELALAGVPMVVAYKMGRLEYMLRFLVTAPSIVLPNLILGARAIPEFLQQACTPQALAAALLPLLPDGAARASQLAALGRLDGLMQLDAGDTPSAKAARIVIAMARRDNLLYRTPGIEQRDARLP